MAAGPLRLSTLDRERKSLMFMEDIAFLPVCSILQDLG